MFKISPAVRISFSLMMFALSVLLIADLFGVIPKRDVIQLDARKKICEVLAVQLSFAASQSEFEVVNSSLEIFVDRNADVIAASMSKVDSSVVAQYGEFIEFSRTSNNKSHDNMVVVPIYAGAEQWGTVNVEFKSLYSSSIFSFFTDSIFGLLIFFSLSCFIGFMFILRKSLTVLDPKKVVPDRVHTAFNTLAEGVMILDDKERIIMANDAFANKINQESDDLLGTKVSALKWKHINSKQHQSKDKMPWNYAIKDGINKMGVALNLSTTGTGIRSFSTNCAPIQDDKGKIRGALVTLDDVTDVEETNVSLENAVTTLKNNELEIKRKNNELKILATRDPLTGCYNRRAFFDLTEKALEEAEKTDTNVSIIMIDIDHFKSFNDRFGHSVGDEAIRLVSDVLNNHCAVESAIVGRYGGEEFCIALPNIDSETAVSVAENLRQVIQNSSSGFCADNVVITASFGVSCNNDAAKGCSQILEQADHSLYIAKESGRNRVVSWNQDDLSRVDDITVIDFDNKNSILDVVDHVEENKDNVSFLQKHINDLEAELKSIKSSSEDINDNYIDPITKLPTRAILEDRISQAMANSNRSGKAISVAVINIDMFRRINATMGQAVGDKFLRAVGHRLKNILRRSDTVASMMSPGQSGPSFSRLRDDEFAVLLTGLNDVESLTYVIKRIQNKFCGKLEVSGSELYVTTSIGLSVYPRDGDLAQDLIENARRAQKQAKRLIGRNNFQFYSLEDNRKILDQMQIEIELHNAIEQNQFQLLYQPKMNLKTNTINSMEALIRWNHPDKGLIFPDAFIPVAEKTGMIIQMGRWCLRTACIQTKIWVDMGADNIRTSVNVSVIEFTDEGFNGSVVQALNESQLDARHLEIELTESIFMEDPESAYRIIEELRFLGVTVTLDDFGTGYSSLSYFGKLKMDWLKLDRSFLLEAMDNKRADTMYSGIVRMAHETGVKVVSEGVETQAQHDYVKHLKVDELQGYILSKPIDVTTMMNFLFLPHNENRVKNQSYVVDL